MTCSIGFAALPVPPEPPLDGKQVVALTDSASYAAKRAGRDRWVGYTAGPDAPIADVLREALEQLEGLVAAGRLGCVRSDTRVAAAV